MNRIATNRFYDIHYISLHRNDKTPNREHCYHVLFPDYWRKQDIISECNLDVICIPLVLRIVKPYI